MARANDARRQLTDKPVPAKAWRTYGLALLGFAGFILVVASTVAKADPALPLMLCGFICGMGLVCLQVHGLAMKGNLRNAEPTEIAEAESRRAAAAAKRDTKEDAVSPVIGVILMVAITVVLAAVVFFLVTKISHSPDVAPTLSFQVTGATSTSFSARLISQSDAVQWDTCAAKTQTGAANPFTVNGAAIVAGSKSGAGDVLQLTGLSPKSHYDLLLICDRATVASFGGDTA